jgi:uncharacterized sodium:solute symporter family permease YidK
MSKQTVKATLRLYYDRLGAGLEIPSLIEYAEIQQSAFSVDFAYPAGLQHSGGIVTIALMAFGKADYYGCLWAIGGEFLNGRAIVVQKMFLEQQIFRRITTNSQFRKEQQIHVRPDSFGVDLAHLFGVADQITYYGIELSQSHAQRVQPPN